MGSTAKSVVCIVTPGTRSANNGNWRTAARWAAMLRDRYQVIVQSEWSGRTPDAMIALHARRSAASVARLRAEHPRTPVAVMLTGTDLYRDLPGSLEARETLDAATCIVALQEDAPRLLQARWAAKTRVIFQSARGLRAASKPRDRLECVAVGHLRVEKDPATLFEAIRCLPAGLPITVRHVGAPLDDKLAAAARQLQADDARYRYCGPLPHGLARAAIKRAHLLVHPSAMEGGANVVVEAVTAGTPVLASRISGNVGMLGTGYPGYFEPGDASGLGAMLVQSLQDRAFLASLREACAARRALFDPAAERRAVLGLVKDLLASGER